MYQFMTKALLVLLWAHYSKCQRRIVNGEEINKSFVVYIVWDLSDKNLTMFYDTTTVCGGFFISENLVVTADECLKIFPNQYVVAGYNKYVPGAVGRNKEEEECLEIAKKPIVERIYFRTSAVHLTSGWQFEDLAIARIEMSRDFHNQAFTEKCSYQPTIANYQYRTLPPGTDVIVYGWGSNRYHRPKNVLFDTNQNYLMATTTKVIALEECDNSYIHAITNNAKIRFCTEGESSLDVYGQPTDTRRANTNNTQREPIYALDVPGVPENKTIVLRKSLSRVTRRHGPCQHDHGGPIATWENGTEIVIGIVTGYLVNKDMECVAPYLYSQFIYFKNFIDSTLHNFTQH